MRDARIRNLCLVALLLLGCSGDSSGPGAPGDLPRVRVAINTWPGLGPFYVAEAKGFDRDEGVRLEVLMTEDTVARRSSLAAGEVDLVGITLDTVVIARSQGVDMKAVGQSDFSFGGDGIIARKDISSVRDLKGKRVACAEGLPSHFLLIHALREHGLAPDDIDLVPADDGSQAATLFTSGRVDAAVTWDPWISRAEELTDGKVILTTRDAPRVLLGIVAANSSFLEERRDRIFRALKAWFKAVRFCRDQPDEAARIMAGKFNVSVEEFKNMALGAQLADLSETLHTFGTPADPGPIAQLAQDASDLWLQVGAIRSAVEPREVVDWSVVQMLQNER